MERRQFLNLLITAAVGCLAAACGRTNEGDGTFDNNSSDSCFPDDSISGNHGHSLTVSAADIEAGVKKSYQIQGAASHGHTVTITASQFTQLRSLKSITVTTSSGGGHAHTVTVGCA